MFYFDFPRHAPPSPRWGFHAHPSPISELSRSFAGQGDRGNKYQYNGIELIDDFGLNANHALYRTLDPQLGRWWQIDPKAEEFYGWSPYHSNMDNPVRYEDPEGDTPDNYYRNKDGDLVAVVRTKDSQDNFYTVNNDNTVRHDVTRDKEAGWSRLTDGAKNGVVNRVANSKGKAPQNQVNDNGLTPKQQEKAQLLSATSGNTVRQSANSGTPIVQGDISKNGSPIVDVFSPGTDDSQTRGSLVVITTGMPKDPGGYTGEVPEGVLPTPAPGETAIMAPGSLPPNQIKGVGPDQIQLTDKNGNLPE